RAGFQQGVEWIEVAGVRVTNLERHVEVPHPRIFHCVLDTGLCVRLEFTLRGAESAGPMGPRLSRRPCQFTGKRRVAGLPADDAGPWLPLSLTSHRAVSRGNTITPLRFPTMTVAADDVLG